MRCNARAGRLPGRGCCEAVRRCCRTAAGIAILALAGCASVPEADYGPTGTGAVPERIELTEVPFFPQEEYQCGPAALAMVMTYAGVSRRPDDVAAQVYLPRRKGSLQPEMRAAADRAGLIAFVPAPQPEALLDELAAGHPLVVLLNLRYDVLAEWHYAVVVGYDPAARAMILRSGDQRRQLMPVAEFDRAWDKAGRWALEVLAPDRLPAAADEAGYVAAAVDLERAAPQSARTAYQTALGKWPDDLVARLGLGNIAYGNHDLAEAEAQYRRATLAHPESGDAWNNLAQVLHDQGQDAAALDAANQAVAIGGSREAVYQSTLSAIKP